MRIASLLLAFQLMVGALAAQNLPVENPLAPAETFVPAESIGDPAPLPTAAGSLLQPFGYQLFTQQRMSEELSETGTLPSGYRLGPGDRIGIFLGGKSNEQFQVTVTADGKIYLPTVGVLAVQGLEFERFQKVLEEALRRYYSDVELDLMLLQPKRIRVAVLGQVKAPGTVTLGGFGSVLDALILAQGPTLSGSLRNICVFRGDSSVATMDLYRLLLDPARVAGILLQNGDRIFVPDVTSRVIVQGEVRRPAVYELQDSAPETAQNLIEWAGGVTDLAYSAKVELSRQNPDGTRSVSYFSLSSADDMSQMLPLRNLDRITVYSKLDQVGLSEVTLHGEVKNPGVYPLEENMRVSDLILQAGNVLRSAYLLQAEVAKVDPLQSPRIIKLNLAGLLSGENPEEDILLEADDHVFVRRIPQWEVTPLVEVTGEMMFPGKYVIVKDSTTLSEILQKAGGFTPNALITEAKLIRQHAPMVEDKEFDRLQDMTREEMSDTEYEYFVMKKNTLEIQEVVVDFSRLAFGKDLSEDVVLLDGDRIIVPRKPNVLLITGRVARPGAVLYQPGASVKHYIAKAGGFAWDAAPGRTKVIKANGEILNDEDVKSFEPGDRIWVPRKQDKSMWESFTEVMTAIYQMATVYLVIRAATE